MRQVDAADLMGINQWTYLTWEQDKTYPAIRMLPRVIKFLGYYPFRSPETLGERQ